MASDQTWTIIVFAFNEESGITTTVLKTLDALKKICNSEWELIIVDDGSKDKTYNNILPLSANYPQIKIIRHNKNLGIGHALLSGYRESRFNNVCAIPADGQFDPAELIPFAEIREDTIVSFYRGKKIRYSFFRKFLSFGNRVYNRYFLGIRIKDVNWVKVYKQNMLQNIPSVLHSSLVESEICAKIIHKGLNIIEAPSVYHERKGGKSKGASFKVLIQALKEMPVLYFEVRRYRKAEYSLDKSKKVRI